MHDKTNKVTTVLKVVVTGEFYDDDATEETLRYTVEQDLEDAGFDVDVALLKEQEAVVRCKDCKHYGNRSNCPIASLAELSQIDLELLMLNDWFCADGERTET